MTPSNNVQPPGRAWSHVDQVDHAHDRPRIRDAQRDPASAPTTWSSRNVRYEYTVYIWTAGSSSGRVEKSSTVVSSVTSSRTPRTRRRSLIAGEPRQELLLAQPVGVERPLHRVERREPLVAKVTTRQPFVLSVHRVVVPRRRGEQAPERGVGRRVAARGGALSELPGERPQQHTLGLGSRTWKSPPRVRLTRSNAISGPSASSPRARGREGERRRTRTSRDRRSTPRPCPSRERRA